MDIIIMIIATYVQLIQTWQFLITFHFLIKKKYFQDEFRHSIAHMCTCTYVHVILNAQQYTCTYTLHFILRAIFKNIRLSANVVYCLHIVRNENAFSINPTSTYSHGPTDLFPHRNNAR